MQPVVATHSIMDLRTDYAATEASAPPNGQPSYLLAMHDFTARSPDELSLRKGETVELIADDSEFGDGWYMGRCLATDQKGLFPQVYTTPIIVDERAATKSPAPVIKKSTTPKPAAFSTKQQQQQQQQWAIEENVNEPLLSLSSLMPEESPNLDSDMPPLIVEKVPKTTAIVTDEKSITIVEERQIAELQVTASPGHGMVSPVVEDTLSDIEEAISEISARNNKILRIHNQRHSAIPPPPDAGRQEIHDSSSEYSRHDEPGESSSEFEDDSPVMAQAAFEIPYTADEVRRWTPAQVAEYLRSRKVTQSTCDKFQEQEVSGAILIQLQMIDLKELDLGSFGRRFEVWKEIEYLVENLKFSTRSRSCSASKTMVSRFSRDSPSTIRSSSVGRQILPRITSQHNRPASRTTGRVDIEEANSFHSSSGMQPPITATTYASDSPTSTMFERPRSPPLSPPKVSKGVAPHHRENSFDKVWKSSTSNGPNPSTGPLSTHKTTPSFGTNDSVFSGDSIFSGLRSHTPKFTEKSYVSGVESGPRDPQILQKKKSQTSQHRRPSYTEEHRIRTGTAHSKHSRAGSADTLRGDSSSATASSSIHHQTGKSISSRQSNSPSTLNSDYKDSSVRTASVQGKRSTGDSVAGTTQHFARDQTSPSRDIFGSPVSMRGMDDLQKKHSAPSVAGTTASDPRPKSGKERSVSESQNLRSAAASTEIRKKTGKKGTSAYLEGLRNITPLEAAKEGDFSGWMQKRGSGNMGTWKPRFFVLHGRRLSYFYSANDTKERGLIDVTSHKVLPATDDRFVNLQASIAAATSPSTSPASTATSPAFYQSLSSPNGDMSNGEGSPLNIGFEKKEHSKERGWFTFKLVPPAPGASKGVTFTPPRLHYFATDSKEVGRAWMAAIMKATIEIDPNSPVVTSYSAATISLAKAKALKSRPPDLPGSNINSNLMNEEGGMGLAISGVDLDAGDADVEENGEDGNGFNGLATPVTAGTNRTESSSSKPDTFAARNKSNVFLEEGAEGKSLGSGSLRTPSLEKLLTGDSKGSS